MNSRAEGHLGDCGRLAMNTRLDDNRVSSLLGNASTCLHGDAIGDITPGRVMRHARRGVVIARPFSEPISIG